MSEKTIVASLLDSRTRHLAGKYKSLISDQQRYHSQTAYQIGDFDTDEIIAVDTLVSKQVEDIKSSFIPMFDDSERRNIVGESEAMSTESQDGCRTPKKYD